MVLGAVRIIGSCDGVPGSDTFGDDPEYFVKNTEVSAKYQVGFPRSTTFWHKLQSCMKINYLVYRNTSVAKWVLDFISCSLS